MNRQRVLLGCAAIALATSACGPSVRSLVALRQYREAVCAAHDGVERSLVERALDADSSVTLHARAVRHTQLDAINAQLLVDSATTVALVRVDAQSDSLPLDALSLVARIDDDRGRVRAAPAHWQSLSMLTREPLPSQRRVQTWLTPDNLLRGLATIATAGLSLLAPPMRMQQGWRLEDPTHDDYVRLAPRAASLHALVADAGCWPHAQSGSGVRCRWYFVVAAERDERVALTIDARYASRRSSDAHSEASCHVATARTVDLGPLRSLEVTLAARFGDRAVPLSSVARPTQ